MSVILKRPNTNATEINFSYNDSKFQITISYLFELELYINKLESTNNNLFSIASSFWLSINMDINIFRSLNQNAEKQ